jgi:ankyrin repeat protein
MAATEQGGGGGSNDNNTEDLGVVYRAVDAGASAEEVRAILSGGSSTHPARQQWLAAVLEYKSESGETPLQAAHRRRDGPVVGALLESGADAPARFPATGHANALALCIAYGQVDSLRALLRSGRHSADEEVAWLTADTFEGGLAPDAFNRPTHLCVVPPRLPSTDVEQPSPPTSEGEEVFPSPPPQLECLEVLVREFGADVNGRDHNDNTPLHYVWWVAEGHERRAFDALISLGADASARDAMGYTLMYWVAEKGDVGMLRQLVAHGASTNDVDTDGTTALILACGRDDDADPGSSRAEMVSALLPLSSPETRRAVLHRRSSALDLLLERLGPAPAPWEQRAIDALVASGVPVRDENVPAVLPFAARLAARREAKLARRNRSGAMHWRAHEDLVGLAFDFQDTRAAEEGVRRREVRVAELEEELRALGVGTEDTDEDEAEDDEDEDEEQSSEDDESIEEEEEQEEAESGERESGAAASGGAAEGGAAAGPSAPGP